MRIVILSLPYTLICDWKNINRTIIMIKNNSVPLEYSGEVVGSSTKVNLYFGKTFLIFHILCNFE